ncbi:hypothetical protein Ancab_015817 [Ancistrocladus abbreviatus]
MEGIRKQASKLREQVAKQQQALLKQLRHFGVEATVVDEIQHQCHQQLQNLYNSTRAAKHFQKDNIHSIEGFISTSSKQMEIVRRFAEDCCKYGTQSQGNTSELAEVASSLGTSHSAMEKERQTLLGILRGRVCEPLRAFVRDSQLEDARLLVHHYDKLWQEVENQATEVVRQRSKSKDGATDENSIKLQLAEAKLDDLKSRLVALGREATSAMLSVEAQQQRRTFQQLLVMVDAEKSYHQNVLNILEKLNAEMVQEKDLSEPSSLLQAMHSGSSTLERDGCTDSSQIDEPGDGNNARFFAKAVHGFDAQEKGELSLSVNDTVMVHQVAPNGWSKGECNGRIGWFPSAYIERVDKTPATTVTGES